MGVPTVGPCLVCGQWCDWLPTHLKYSHGMTMAEYTAQYPDAVKARAVTTYIAPPAQPTRAALEAQNYLYRRKVRGQI